MNEFYVCNILIPLVGENNDKCVKNKKNISDRYALALEKA